MTAPELVAFAGGRSGRWRVDRQEAVSGGGLERVERLEVGLPPPSAGAAWVLRGVTSNERYVTAGEHQVLVARQAPLGRPDATRAALIPIKKSEAWWQLAQDDRRAIFEERSRHIALGLEFLPAIARRLHHCRDLGEPFDFLTWFEYAPADAGAFERLVAALRSTEEWGYVEREIDIRLTQD